MLILHMFYDVAMAAYHFTMRNHLPGPSSSHRQSCPSRSVAGTSPARVVSTECTEPVSSPASSPLTAQQATAVSGCHRSVSPLLSHESDLLSGSALCDLPLSSQYSFRTKDGLSSLAWSGSLVPSVPSLATASPRLVL